MPVFKVNNAPQNVPVRPPWMRQDSIPQVNNSAPWRKQNSVQKNDGPDSEPVAVPPAQPGQRKQSKIEIIPSAPSAKNIPGMAVPPPIPAPPQNPNLNLVRKDSAPAIQVSSRKVSLKPVQPKQEEQPKQETNGVQKKNAQNEENNFKTKIIDIKTADSTPAESAKPQSAPQNEAKPKAAPVKRQQTVQEAPKVEKAPPPVKSAPKEQEKPQNAPPSREPEKQKPQNAPSKEPEKQKPRELEKQMPREPEKQNPKEPEKQQKPQEPEKKKAAPREAEKPQKREAEKQPQREEPQKSAPMPPPPPPPSMPPAPPPPPAMPGQGPNKAPIPVVKKAKLDSLRSRPRRRPDWCDMMKEVEEGVKLRKVQTNDRSQPVLPKVKAKGNFIYESERSHSSAHINLLKQINKGIKLNKVKTNDRSKPNLQGLRKFRRQMTVEEQLLGTEPVTGGSEDELDDIDKVRDDLQSTKQMLQVELAEKLRLRGENERLLAEMAKLRQQMANMVAAPSADGENPLVAQLRREAEEARAEATRQAALAQTANQHLGMTQAQLEDAQHRCLVLEKKTGGCVPESSSSGTQTCDLQRVESKREARREQTPLADSEEETEEEETEEEETEEEEEEEGDKAKQTQELRDLKMQQAKLRSLKEKAFNALDEKRALRYQVNNLQKALRMEQKKFSSLQREVSKMTKEECESEEEDEEEEESSESESETETESEPDSEPEDNSDPPQFRIEALGKKNKAHENRLAMIRKGNYMLKATVDKLKESLGKQQGRTLDVQQELNTIVAELG